MAATARGPETFSRTSESGPKPAEAPAATVSVIIVNRNGGAEAVECCRSLLSSTPPPEQIIIVDNGSSDRSIEMLERLRQKDHRVEVVALRENVGPAAARNIGVQQASEPVIAFLDNDTVVHPRWIPGALEVMERLDADCVQCKLRLRENPHLLDSVGYLAGPFGFPRHLVRIGEPDGPEFGRPRLLFGTKSAGMFITREVFDRAGGFDPSFFIYGEECDLCWRVLRCGGTVALAPESQVFHRSGGTKRLLPNSYNALLYRGGTRNYIRIVAKNQHPNRLLLDLFGQMVIWSLAAVLQLLRLRPYPARLIALGVFDAVRELPAILRERSRTRLPYRPVPQHLMQGIDLDYLARLIRAF
jgi:GT2 family glycosyltransferase